MTLSQEDIQKIVDAFSNNDLPIPTQSTLKSFQGIPFYSYWSNAFEQLGLSGVVSIPNTTNDEYLWYFHQWAVKFSENYYDFKYLVNNTFNQLNTDIGNLKDDFNNQLSIETAARIENDTKLQQQIDNFNTNVGFDFGRQKIIQFNFDESIAEVGGEIPLYYQEQIDGSTYTAIPQDNFNVGFITDNHFQYGSYSPNSDAHYAYAGRISRNAQLDAFVAGGDNINGDHNRKNKYNQTMNVTETLLNRVSDKTDVFFMLGNHDTGIGQSAQTNQTNLSVKDNLGENVIKKFYRTKEKLFDEIRNGDSLYGYKDYADYKIRLIFLNTFDLPFTSTNGIYDFNFLQNSGLQNEQLNWLANNALKTPDNTWQALIFSHAPISGTFGNESNGTGIKQYNTDALIGILKAYQEGTAFSIKDLNRTLPVDINVDFSNNGVSKIIAFISGHVHEDGQMVYQGINCIESMCSLCNTPQRPGRLADTEDEDAQDVFSIDREKSKIFIYRLGFGINREFTY